MDRICHFHKNAPRLPLDHPFTIENAQKALEFHKTLPGYAPTPLVSLKDYAKQARVGAIFVKDESGRFGLNAFKALGGSFAMACELARRAGLDTDAPTYDEFCSPRVRAIAKDTTFVTATDGNHGRGVAAAARLFGAKSVVYMPKGSAAERLANIRKEGAEASIVDENYDGAVRLAAKKAEENGWVLVQDTAWEGYETIPTEIMLGYTSMALECVQKSAQPPTHVILQAGVGSMAGAVAAFLSGVYRKAPPKILIVEPHAANCVFQSAKAGALRAVTGEMRTIMAGLACGEVCPIGWRMLQNVAEDFFSIDESVAAHGMRVLGAPQGRDARVIAGESGAAGFGLLSVILENAEYRGLRDALGFDESARIWCVNTEGATDRENYRRIVHDGAFPG